jgi:hypothetical protein
MTRTDAWKLGVLLPAALALGYIVASGAFSSPAHAQGDGEARGIICLVGGLRQGGDTAPIVLVDTAEQTMMVYKFDYGHEDVEFVASRTFRFDKLVTEFNIDGASVDAVRRRVSR